MPSYELSLVLRVLPKEEIAATLKRTAMSIFNIGGIMRRIDNLGIREIPFKTSSHGTVHKEAGYFVMEFDAPPSKLHHLKDDYSRDVDIIRSRIYKMNTNEPFECTFEEEMQPPPYRKEVIKMIEESKKKRQGKKFSYNTGLDYYPFQR